MIAQAGGSPRGVQFAAKYADTIIASQPTPDKMKDYRDRVRAAAVGHGRNPDDIKVLFLVNPIVGLTKEEAEDRAEARVTNAVANIDIRLASMSKSTDIDFSSVPRDVPLGELQLATNGTQLFVEFAKRNPTLTLTEAVAKQAGGEGRAYVGTPDIVASRLAETMQQVGGDGFLIGTNGLTRRQIAEICDGLVPELQRRGLTRRAYEHATLRENLRSF